MLILLFWILGSASGGSCKEVIALEVATMLLPKKSKPLVVKVIGGIVSLIMDVGVIVVVGIKRYSCGANARGKGI